MKVELEQGDPGTEAIMKVVVQSSLMYGEPFFEWISNNLPRLWEIYKEENKD